MADAPTTDVVAPRDLSAIRNVLGTIRQEIELSGTGEYESMVLGILNDIATAETEEELFAAQDLPPMTAGKDFLNIPFRLLEENIAWRPSTLTDDWFFAILQVQRMDTGEWVTVDCGGKTFVTILRKLQLMDGFKRFADEGGRPLMLTAKGSEGNQPLFLRPVNLTPPAEASKTRAKTRS